MTDTLQSSTATHTTPVATSPFPTLHPEAVRARLLARDEMLFADLREEDPYAKGHPLWAANFPFGRLELDVLRRVPRRDVLIVLYGEDDYRDLAPLAAAKLHTWGYTNVHLLEGGLQAWERQGYQMFIDVNVPSKAFGEWVESRRHTPLLPAEDVHRLIDSDKPPVILDVRRYDEYHTMSIPTGISVPGAELVLRVRELAPDPETTVVVNCAGRTRSIIGTQSLINAGIPNPVVGLRNGTIGWLLAGLTLDNGATRRFPEARPDARRKAQADARRVAERAGVRRVSLDEAASLAAPGGASTRTVYRVDVRTAEEYRDGHLPGFINVPGGQLVQETDHTAAVSGALIFLADDDGVRADMSASWLAQMGWEVYVIDPLDPAQRTETGDGASETIPPSDVKLISPQALSDLLARNDGGTMVLDVTTSANYVKGHTLVPGLSCGHNSMGRCVRWRSGGRSLSVLSSHAERAHWRAMPRRMCRLFPARRYSYWKGATRHGVRPTFQWKRGRHILCRRGRIAIVGPTRVRKHPVRRWKRILNGSMVSWRNWSKMPRTSSR